MITTTQMLGAEERLLRRTPAAMAQLEAIAAVAQTEIRALNSQLDDARTDLDRQRIDAALDTAIRRSLEEYARQSRGLFSADDRAQWKADIARVPGSYVTRAAATGVPGSLTLLDTLEGFDTDQAGTSFQSMDETLARGAEHCRCGYARNGVVPEMLCVLCSGAVLAAWDVEEQRLLEGAPTLRADLDAVFDELLDELVRVRQGTGAHAAALAVRRRAGQRGITRANSDHAAEITTLDLTRWNKLSDLTAHTGSDGVRALAKFWPRWGLGSARLSTLAIPSAPELQARQRQLASTKPLPKPGLFERWFSRRRG